MRQAGAQTDSLADDVWSNLSALAEQWEITIQWIPGHKDIKGNEAADKAAKEAASMNQDEAALDFSTMKAAIKKTLSEEMERGSFSQSRHLLEGEHKQTTSTACECNPQRGNYDTPTSNRINTFSEKLLGQIRWETRERKTVPK